MYENNLNPYQQQPGFGFGGVSMNYGQPVERKVKNVLTPEEMAQLQQKCNQFSLNLTDEEILKSRCNHRNQNGELALADTADGEHICTICGEKFREVDMRAEDVEDVVATMNDILQTVKLLYGDMPAQAAKEYYQIIPLIKKLPKLMTIANDNFNKYDNANQLEQQNINNPYAILNAFANPAFNPMYQQTYQQPMGYGQPAPQPAAYQQPVNPFGQQAPMYGQPAAQQMGYAPTTQGFQYNPGMGSQQQPVNPQVAPVNPQVGTPVVDANVAQGEVKVNAQLQA